MLFETLLPIPKRNETFAVRGNLNSRNKMSLRGVFLRATPHSKCFCLLRHYEFGTLSDFGEVISRVIKRLPHCGLTRRKVLNDNSVGSVVFREKFVKYN